MFLTEGIDPAIRELRWDGITVNAPRPMQSIPRTVADTSGSYSKRA